MGSKAQDERSILEDMDKLKQQLIDIEKKADDINRRLKQLSDFAPKSEAGKAAKQQAIERLETEYRLLKDIISEKARVTQELSELLTVQEISGFRVISSGEQR